MLSSSGCASAISQMPVVLLPLHFDRDATCHQPSCQRSVVIRTFITHDFMTGVPATPGKQLPLEVRTAPENGAEAGGGGTEDRVNELSASYRYLEQFPPFPAMVL